MACLILETSAAGNFYRDVKINFGDGRAKIDKSGQLLTLSLDKLSGSGFESTNDYLFGRFDMQIKFVPGNSAGTVTTFFAKGTMRLISSPRKCIWPAIYTSYQCLCTRKRKQGTTIPSVVRVGETSFLVDGSPIRAFNNNEGSGISFPKNQPMKVYCSLWNADDWATQGGQIKTDWTLAPFLASYRNFNADACVWSASAGSSCASKTPHSINTQAWENPRA
ncbi:xyloglucan endotransglucosylase/hydrolase protein 22-like [Coffea arabica]|uniref:Xyloglucan endotransglucosylase/hydrolase protein 22-like n=1 Tax=Coffea arabica TaxID=13443 RepID=A0ABM4X7P9_COFAR